VGLGHVGRAVASRLAAWKVKLLGFDPLAATSTAGVTLVDFDTLLRESNIVSLHASPTAANRHLINRAALSKMRAGSVLINTARASLVDTAALCDALRSGHLVGAGVDVFDEEPPDPAAALFTFENVVVTPHAAAWTNQGVENIGWHAARNLHAMLTGRGHADVVNRRNSATATIGSYT
jgi:D-3-phosphoglycerate dehydrogenase